MKKRSIKTEEKEQIRMTRSSIKAMSTAVSQNNGRDKLVQKELRKGKRSMRESEIEEMKV